MQKTDLQKHLQTIQDRSFDPVILRHNSFRACIHRSAQNLGLIKNGQLTAKGRQHMKLQF
ncbi:hypothetical protein [Loigolactobacillus zhaoyuanensis]|uniref:R3H domain-containing protein n=1 Tax=Loigolactobacillus zhaoyuanensis TaxID=2486017 RepID=A0ABW8UCP5_9LACO|nr:hypothetical protein [Loigolactobacillus zhaoyuanensis]